MNKQLEELKAAALAATPGPWISGDDSWSDGDNANITTEERNDMGIIDIAQVNGGGSESDLDGAFRTEQQANARYIAEANPAAVLALIAELESAQQRIAELERANNEMQRMELTEQITAEALTEHIARLAQSLTDEKKKSAALERDCGIYDNTVKELQERAGSAETRIAELEGMEQTLNVANDATRIWKERAEAAEAKLATPVRLPQLCGDGDNDTEYTEGLNDGITQSAIYLRRQGFKVEGDA